MCRLHTQALLVSQRENLGFIAAIGGRAVHDSRYPTGIDTGKIRTDLEQLGYSITLRSIRRDLTVHASALAGGAPFCVVGENLAAVQKLQGS